LLVLGGNSSREKGGGDNEKDGCGFDLYAVVRPNLRHSIIIHRLTPSRLFRLLSAKFAMPRRRVAEERDEVLPPDIDHDASPPWVSNNE
jgi:hypothetical protein